VKIGKIIRFHDERFFEGAVQLGWAQKRIEQARQAATSFVFHGPRYHGGDEAQRDGIDGGYRLKDTASFVRDLLESILVGVEGKDANPYWLVVAGYGSGKSHLALTCATLLADPTGDTAKLVLEQIAHADAEIGQEVFDKVQQLAKPALVLPLDGMSGFHLGNALSRAVFQQLKIHGLDATAIRDLSPRFETAEHFVARNFLIRPDQFAQRLPELDCDQICSRLREHDEAVYSEIDAIFFEANGRPIPVEGQESAQDLIDTLCSVYCGPDKPFSQVVILFDEFGRYLEYAAEKPHLAGDSALQQIFQGVQDNSNKVRFLGFIQYELRAYLKRFGGADLRQLQRYVTRFDAADKFYLSSNLETIFAHMIGKDESALDVLWNKTKADKVASQSWGLMSRTLPGFANFPVWNDPERFIQVIARGCWPLHPLAVWFLTRQRDVVQSRSALTFIKDVIDRESGSEAQINGSLRQVCAAELVRNMLSELIAAERETGGTTAETLQVLLTKLEGHLTREQGLLLTGVAALEKMRVGPQSQDVANSLLGEVSGLNGDLLPPILESLSELGALEWNRDLGQYELLSDGTSRAQFQQWLRTKQSSFTADMARDLFVRKSSTDIELADIPTDFSQRNQISTPDWFFEAQFAHAHTIENAVRTAFREWEQAHLPKDAKGKVIYLYLHPDDDLDAIGIRLEKLFNEELNRIGQPRAPVWVVGIVDKQGALADHIGRLHMLSEQLSANDEERFRRFIPEERTRSRLALKDGAQLAIKERLYWVAGFSEVPPGRLSTVAQVIFTQVYPKALPFPFDGFATAAGGGAADSAQLMRGLIARQVNGAWVQAQPRRLQNRVDAVLVQSWKSLLPSGQLCEPQNPAVSALYKRVEKLHQEDVDLALAVSYFDLIKPPYGLNASSAGLFLGVLLASETPPRRIELAGQLVASSDWLNVAFSGQRSYHIDSDILCRSRLRFLSEDATARWRSYLNRWESEKNYLGMLTHARDAKVMERADPIPEILEGKYKFLLAGTAAIEEKLKEVERKLKSIEQEIEHAERRESVAHSIKYGAQLLVLRNGVSDTSSWPESYVQECTQLIELTKGQITQRINTWIPTQLCRNAVEIIDFRQRNERLVRDLESLGFVQQAQALNRQVQSSIQRIEQLQNHRLTLAASDDYPRQFQPTESTTVRAIRDELSTGDELIEALNNTAPALSQNEIEVRVEAIKTRQKLFQDALNRKRDALGALYQAPKNEQELREALSRASHLRNIFVGTPDEAEVSELILQFERIVADLQAWGADQVSPDRLEELLLIQVEQQLTALTSYLEEKEIDPAWDLAAIYQAIAAERIDNARRRSSEWVEPRLKLAIEIATSDRVICDALERELSAPPSFLAVEARQQVGALLESIRTRIASLDEQLRQSVVAKWQERFLPLPDVGKLERRETEELLHSLRNPPCTLKSEEVVNINSAIDQLTVRLDEVSVDEIVNRIRRLSVARQREIQVQLFAILQPE
jgi:hypothetical protein